MDDDEQFDDAGYEEDEVEEEEIDFDEWIAEREVCPACGDEGVHILRGLPTEDAFLASERGSLVLGGCLVEDEMPEWECLSCGLRWNVEIDYAVMDVDALFKLAIAGDESAFDYLRAHPEI